MRHTLAIFSGLALSGLMLLFSFFPATVHAAAPDSAIASRNATIEESACIT